MTGGRWPAIGPLESSCQSRVERPSATERKGDTAWNEHSRGNPNGRHAFAARTMADGVLAQKKLQVNTAFALVRLLGAKKLWSPCPLEPVGGAVVTVPSSLEQRDARDAGGSPAGPTISDISEGIPASCLITSARIRDTERCQIQNRLLRHSGCVPLPGWVDFRMLPEGAWDFAEGVRSVEGGAYQYCPSLTCRRLADRSAYRHQPDRSLRWGAHH